MPWENPLTLRHQPGRTEYRDASKASTGHAKYRIETIHEYDSWQTALTVLKSIAAAPQCAAGGLAIGHRAGGSNLLGQFIRQIHMVQRQTAYGDLVLFREFFLLTRVSIPWRQQPTGIFLLPVGLEFFHGLAGRDIRIAEIESTIE